MRTWIAYGFKQIKNELGWADHRLTDDAAIERWWEPDLQGMLISIEAPSTQNVQSARRLQRCLVTGTVQESEDSYQLIPNGMRWFHARYQLIPNTMARLRLF